MDAFEAWYADLRRTQAAVPGVDQARFFQWLALGSPGSRPAPDPWPPRDEAEGSPAPVGESENPAAAELPEAPPWETETDATEPLPVAPFPDEAAAPADEHAPSPRSPRRARWSEPRPIADLVAYTDGSGTRAHLVCGAGVVIVDGRPETVSAWEGVEGVTWLGGGVVVLEVSRHLGLGTNNHAELCAAGLALGATDTPDWHALPLEIRTDSTYVEGCLTAPSDPEPHRPNARVIVAARRRMRERADEDGEVWPARRVAVCHVEGHTGEPGNDRADQLAGAARLRPPHPTERPESLTPPESP
jgi:ribonuclease HI